MARERVEERFAVDVVDRNCHVTVVTYITECRATATASLGKAAFGTGNELEPAIAKVPKELVILEIMIFGLVCLRIDVAVGNEQFLPSVIIKINEARAPFQLVVTGSAQSGLICDVFEAAPAVVIERAVVLGKIGDQQVEPAIVVVIPHGDAHRGLRAAVRADRAPRLKPDLFKGSF